jgi:hypothetical protein
MPAVSDTSPILGLAVIGHLALLHEQFGEIYIPLAVLEELKTETNFRGVPAVQEALQDGWIISREVQNKPLVTSLSVELNQGESEAITLAMDLGVKIIVMDERLGRDRARTLGLQTVGVLGILLTAKKHGQITSLKDEMTALRNEIGFFISDELYQRLVLQAGE